MADTILVVNSGSSSIKFEVFEIADGALRRHTKGAVEGIGTRPRLAARDAAGATVVEETYGAADMPDIPRAMARLGAFLRDRFGGALPMAIGHRVVHGGPDHDRPAVVDDAVLDRLAAFIPLAPLHQPYNLAAIRAIRRLYPDIFQVACFDTAFHRGHPEVANRYAIPEDLYREGVRRYGFHGLSYEYIARCLPELGPGVAHGRVVAAHLGSGASLCAIQDGRSVDSTMGFTALDGLPMGTRPGQLDPGIVLYLMDKGMDARAIEHLLYHDCGLKGLSGISNDVRDLLASGEPRAELALDCFVYRIALGVGSLAAAMEGLDAVVFTAGIGERSGVMRARIGMRLRWLGLDIDAEANERGERCISKASSRVRGFIVPTDEERMIALHTRDVLERHD
jgi:acetate kinase